MTNRFDINRSQRGIPAFSVLLIVIGVAMLPMLNVQYTPSPVERKIDVSFTWPDASARLIEQSVTSRIEGALSAITGSESVSSRSSKGSGRVTIRFRKGTEMAAARFEVASAIRNLYPKLPEEVSYPAISIATGGTRESDMLVYTIKADLPSRRIEEYVEAHMSTPLSQTEGVGKVSLSGVTPFEWVITFDPKAMEVNGISAADLAAAFRDYFRSDVIGLTTLPHADGTDRSIVLKLRNRASLNFGDIPIARRNGRIYHLRDFATARPQPISASTDSTRSPSPSAAKPPPICCGWQKTSKRRCNACKPPSRRASPRRSPTTHRNTFRANCTKSISARFSA